jgi:hypothetical protein
MAKVISFQEHHHRKSVACGRSLWAALVSEPLTAELKLADLSDASLLTLAKQEAQTSGVFADLTAAILQGDSKSRFDRLPPEKKMDVLDIQLFFVDQIRWELLRRLGWASGFPGETHPISELIINARTIKNTCHPPHPELSASHPEYDEFRRRRNLDAEVLLRKLIPAALNEFSRSLQR